MPRLLHTATDQSFDITGKDELEIQKELLAADLRLGRVTLRHFIAGSLTAASGFEILPDLTEEEKAESAEALSKVSAATTSESATSVITDTSVVNEPSATTEPQPSSDAEPSETVVEPTTVETLPGAEVEPAAETVAEIPNAADADDVIAAGDTAADPTPAQTIVVPETAEDPVDPEAEARAEEIRRRMLGTSGLTTADSTPEQKAAQNLTPQSATEPRKRRHNARQDSVDLARNTPAFVDVIKAIEASVTPALELNYVNPDLRWLEFSVIESRDPAAPNSRKTPYLDLSPLYANGDESSSPEIIGWGFSLYRNGKTSTKRQRQKTADVGGLVAAISAFLANPNPAETATVVETGKSAEPVTDTTVEPNPANSTAEPTA